MREQYASPSLRDHFLRSLEPPADRMLAVRLALTLLGCTNPLPGITCTDLGLPAKSTYDGAARRVLTLFLDHAAGSDA